MERSQTNPGGAYTSWQVILEAINTPTNQWTKRHEYAALDFTPKLLNLARSASFRFGIFADYHFCSDAMAEWWQLALINRAPSMNSESEFTKCARGIMKNAVGRVARERKKLRARSMSEADNPCTNALTPLDELEQLQTRKEFAAEIDRLKTSLREPLKCIFYDGLSTMQTAAKLGVTPNAVRVRLHRAKRILRCRLSRFRE